MDLHTYVRHGKTRKCDSSSSTSPFVFFFVLGRASLGIVGKKKRKRKKKKKKRKKKNAISFFCPPSSLQYAICVFGHVFESPRVRAVLEYLDCLRSKTTVPSFFMAGVSFFQVICL